MHELLDQWGMWQRAGRRAPRTVTERCRFIERFLEHAGADPRTCTAMDVAAFLTAHEQSWSTQTAATYFSYLLSWHKWLVLMGHRTDNPMYQLQGPRRPERSPRPVTDEELAALLNLRMKKRTRAMVLVAALAGLRVSEIARLRAEDLDLTTSPPRIRVLGKGGKQKFVPLHPLLVELAKEMPCEGIWFPGNSRRPGQPMLSKSVSQIIGNAMVRAGVRGTPHALRHWYATSLLAEGADLRTVQELMRHTSVQTTQVYTQVPDARRAEAIARLDPFRAA